MDKKLTAESRITNFFRNIGIDCGDDPTAFIIASYKEMVSQRDEAREELYKIKGEDKEDDEGEENNNE